MAAVRQRMERSELRHFFADLAQFSSLQFTHRSNFACCPVLRELLLNLGLDPKVKPPTGLNLVSVSDPLSIALS